MFKIIKNQPVTNSTTLKKWTKSAFYDDFSKEQIKEVVQYEKPQELPENLIFPYINILERELYSWKDLAFVKEV